MMAMIWWRGSSTAPVTPASVSAPSSSARRYVGSTGAALPAKHYCTSVVIFLSRYPMASREVRSADRQTGKSYSRQEFTAWLVESCERQHVAVTITNPAVLADIATLLR
ncbi:Uncharacterised protein [Mycobacteroides abscessus]|nr:Uncharacterised protein [Mycobacteroides abscessus]